MKGTPTAINIVALFLEQDLCNWRSLYPNQPLYKLSLHVLYNAPVCSKGMKYAVISSAMLCATRSYWYISDGKL